MNPSDQSADDDSSSDESVDSSKFQAVENYNASPYNNGSSIEHQNSFHLTGNNYGTHKRKSSYDIVPAKRNRASTYGTSSNTSNGSGQESDDDPPEASDFDGYRREGQYSTKSLSGYRKQSSDDNIRLSRSSVSETRSSPIDQFEAGKTGFEENDTDNGEDFARPSFQSPDSFYNRNSKEIEEELPSGYSEKSKRMMSNMGYKPGKGLGKHESGRTEPVEASTQKGRRGLGLEPSVVGEIPQDFQWGPDSSRPDALENLEWLPCKEEPLSIDELEEWLQKGQKKLTIDDETYFVKESVLKGVLESKSIFDSLDDKDLRNARFRSNPYETIGSVIFINRAAVKMANIDSICDFMFTKPKDKHGNNVLHDTKDILYFADVCAGPGGFSEYVLYRKGWNCKGFGFTLTGPCDFKLSDFFAGTPETFNAYYGVKEDGNIFDPENLDSLKNYVLTQTEDRGVHFLMADGGFSVVGQENIQEILSKQLYLCQCLAALMLVRTGGHFVVKLFDVFTLFSVGLLYIMYRCFDEVSIHKPVTSRPANSERYLICKWKKSGTEAAERHLFNVNEMLCDAESAGDDVTQLVPLTVMQKDKKFFEYIYQSNNVIGERQIKNLLKIAAYSKDKNLTESTQAEMKKQCLRLWKLPDQSRKCPDRMNPDDTLMTIISSMEQAPPDSQSHTAFKNKTLNKPPTYLTSQSELQNFGNVYDWHFMFLTSCRSSSELRIFLGCGNRHVYKFENFTWMSVSGITLPPKTLIYGEIVREYQGVGTMQMFTKALHIVDGLMLGGVDISTLPLSKRLRQCSLFCTALDKPFDRQSIPIRCKSLFEMEKFDSALDHLELRTMKSVKKAVTIDIPNRSIRVNKFYVVGSMMFIKEIKEPWVAQLSRTNGLKYYFRMGPDKKPQSEYFIPNGAQLDMLNGYLNRVMWSWGDGAPAFLEGRPCSGISRKNMQDYIAYKTA